MIAGSHTLPLVGVVLIRPLYRAGGAEVLLRRGLHTSAGPLERQVERICRELTAVGLPCPVTWCVPELAGGRSSVFARDIEMVSAADLVLVFLDTASVEDVYSGTYHVFEQALVQERPVYAWTVQNLGETYVVRRFGEHDPDERFAELTADLAPA